jgi:hypothetical protein
MKMIPKAIPSMSFMYSMYQRNNFRQGIFLNLIKFFFEALAGVVPGHYFRHSESVPSCKSLHIKHLGARRARKSLIFSNLRLVLLFYSASLAETLGVEQIIVVFEGGAQVSHHILDDPKLFCSSGLRVL